MNLTRHLRSFVGATIVMIALFAASPAAYAHPGHGHAALPVASRNVVVDALPARQTETDRVPKMWVKATTPYGIPPSERCTGGCCTSASGHACCTFNLPAGIGESAPHGTYVAQVPSNPPSADGINPEAVRKPPRSFA
jgi:hypothetical protein